MSPMSAPDNKLNLETSDLFTTATLPTTRGHNYKLFKPQTTTRVRSTFLQYELSMTATFHVVNAPTLKLINSFKNSLDSSWSTLLHDYYLLHDFLCYII